MNFCTVLRLRTQKGANVVMVVVFYALCVNWEFVFLPRSLVIFSPFASCLAFLNSNIDTVMNAQYLKKVPGSLVLAKSLNSPFSKYLCGGRASQFQVSISIHWEELVRAFIQHIFITVSKSKMRNTLLFPNNCTGNGTRFQVQSIFCIWDEERILLHLQNTVNFSLEHVMWPWVV